MKNRLFKLAMLAVVSLLAIVGVTAVAADAAPVRPAAACGYGTGTLGVVSFTMHWHVNCPGGSNYARAWADCYTSKGHLQSTARGPIIAGDGASSKADCQNLGVDGKYGYDYGPSTSSVPYRVVLGDNS